MILLGWAFKGDIYAITKSIMNDLSGCYCIATPSFIDADMTLSQSFFMYKINQGKFSTDFLPPKLLK